MPDRLCFLQHDNLNAYILNICENFDRLQGDKKDVMTKLVDLIRQFDPLISPAARAAILNIPPRYRDSYKIDISVAAPPPPALPVGCLDFPVVSSCLGAVRRIRVTENGRSEWSAHHREQLDRVGAAVLNVICEKDRIRCRTWDPYRWRFDTLTLCDTEDHTVLGESMDLALAIALYSRLADAPAPTDISASARVDRQGRLGPVEGLEIKLKTLRRERHWITRVYVAEEQERSAGMPAERMLVRKAELADVLANLFPAAKPLQRAIDMDIDTELHLLETCYNNYWVDSCLENADRLIHYLQSDGCPLAKDAWLRALFTCLWRKGSCLCHLGRVNAAVDALKAARKLNDDHPGYIQRHLYFECCNSFGVTLKDVFLYADANALHQEIAAEQKRIGAINHERAKNLSSLSQLYLAMGRLQAAETTQKEAIGLIDEAEQARNYGYLAQIAVHRARYDAAHAHLDHAENLLHTQNDPGRTQQCQPFLEWFRAACLYRQGMHHPAQRPDCFARLADLVQSVPELNFHAPALVHKFAGLAELHAGKRDQALVRLKRVTAYLESQRNPMYGLLSATVHAEIGCYFVQAGEWGAVNGHVAIILKVLTGQAEFKRHFNAEIYELGQCMTEDGLIASEATTAHQVLMALIDKIPY